jgi:hypothetical protein
MLDKLPLELIQHIVRSTFPSSYSPFHYRQRQDTLLALCRTSKGIHQVAQPILLETVELDTEEKLELFFEAVKDGEKGKRVRLLRILNPDAWSGPLSDADAILEKLAPSCKGLVDLRVQNGSLGLPRLEAFPGRRLPSPRFE